MPGARVVGQFDDGPGACQHAEKPFQIRSVGMTSMSVVDTRLTPDDPCKSFVKEKHSSPGALAIHVHDFVVADPAEPLRENVLGRPRRFSPGAVAARVAAIEKEAAVIRRMREQPE
jgi:hypothetical protein